MFSLNLKHFFFQNHKHALRKTFTAQMETVCLQDFGVTVIMIVQMAQMR